MTLTLEPYGEKHIPAVLALNQRLAAAGAAKPYFPTTPRSSTFPSPGEHDRLYQERFVAREGEVIRGGYALKHQDFSFGGGQDGSAVASVGAFQIPVSEGVIAKRHALLGLYLMKDALARNPLLYTLGIGGREEPFARMLASARWRITEVPFFFRVLRGGPFFRNLAYLRTTRQRRLFFDAMAALGLPAAALRTVHRLRSLGSRSPGIRTDRVERFGPWATELWEQCRDTLSFTAVRKAEILDTLYPPDDNDFIRLRFTQPNGTVVGWAVLLSHRLRDHRHFGSLHLGSIVDCLAKPGMEAAIIHGSTRFLRRDGADLVVTNQSHRAWCQGLRRCGYLAGPSNFLLAVSPRLAKRLEPAAETLPHTHMNRGDGDGPSNL